MRRAGLVLLDLHPQSVALFASQTAHRRRTHLMPHELQSLTEVTQTTAHPLLLAHRIPRGFRQHQGFQRAFS